MQEYSKYPSRKLNAAKSFFIDERIGREIEFTEHSLQVQMETELKLSNNKRKVNYQSEGGNRDTE